MPPAQLRREVQLRGARHAVAAAGLRAPLAPPRGRVRPAAGCCSVRAALRCSRKGDARPAVLRGRMVNRVSGAPEMQLHERHDASDFNANTQDKIGKSMSK